jgi:hypothetical protein
VKPILLGLALLFGREAVDPWPPAPPTPTGCTIIVTHPPIVVCQ